MKRSLLGVFATWLFLVPAGHAGKVTISKGGRMIEGIVISRPEALSGKAVVTIRRDLDNRIYQFDLDEIAMIESATEETQILKQAAVIREATSEQSKAVRRFTAGMELRVENAQGDWVLVIPEAEGLKENTGWLPRSVLTRKLDLEAMRKEAAAEAPAETAGEESTTIESPVPEAEPRPEPGAPEPESMEGSSPEPESSGSETTD